MNMIENIVRPVPAALVSFILALPLAIPFVVLWFDIQVLIEPIKQALSTDGQQINMLGRIVLGSGMLLLPVAFVLDLIPVFRTARSERKIAHPLNLLLAAFIFLLIWMTWGGLLTDVVRCEVMGIPN